MKSDLKNNKYATSLLQVLNAPGRSVVVTEEAGDKRDPFRQCLERGWLFSECDDEDQIKYRFASQLHEHYVDWLLRAREDPIKDHDLHTFVIKVLEHFRRTNLKTREDLNSSSRASVHSRGAITAGILSSMLRLYERHGDYSPGMRNPEGPDRFLHSLSEVGNRAFA